MIYLFSNTISTPPHRKVLSHLPVTKLLSCVKLSDLLADMRPVTLYIAITPFCKDLPFN